MKIKKSRVKLQRMGEYGVFPIRIIAAAKNF